MKSQIWNGSSVVLLLVGLTIGASGCSKPADTSPSTGSGAPPTEAVAEAGHNLDGWWCSEHGVPEEECSLCSTEAAEKLKAKNDWCEKHDRADSQCFVCHPELAEKFAARYEAKFGKKPPKPTE